MYKIRFFEVLMKRTTFSRFPIDNASILYLSLMRKDHCNSYRFTITLTEDVCPETLQNAVDRIYRRFPLVIAGFQPGVFRYYQIPSSAAPKVQSDPGCLITMSREEIRNCAFRVYYKENTVSIEAFHALADGYGAIACFSTLIAEYLRLKYGTFIPISETLLDLEQAPMLPELEDSYLDHAEGTPLHLPSRYAYQLPGGDLGREAVHTHTIQLPAQKLLDASRKHGVSVTTLISAVMSATVMEIQKKQTSGKKIKPVRIMVPVDLRRMFPSRTLRNFILYVLPTMEPEDNEKDMSSLLRSFASQMQAQLEKSRLASIMAYNVKTQGSWYFGLIPMSVKLAIMRLAYRYFGESNSSVTVTNLGNVRLPEEMKGYVRNLEVTLTPRMRSPYNCAILSYDGNLSIRISRFPKDSELEAIFMRNLDAVLNGESV